MKTLDLKTFMPTVEQALAMLEIEIENCKKEGTKTLKCVHGYGSKGVGGAIFLAVRAKARKLKKQKVIKNFLCGDEWDMHNQKAMDILKTEDCFGDSDLSKRNPGITIISI